MNHKPVAKFGLSTLAEPLQQLDRVCVIHRGRKLAYFAGCDYFRLASHPEVVRAVREGIEQFGLNVAASRKTTGNHALYEKLERALARFFAVDSAVLVSNGYMTNLAVAQALTGEFTHALIDERAHASLFDAAKFLDCPLIPFAHREAAAAARAARNCGQSAKILLLTDGLFSHSGEVAPLADWTEARVWSYIRERELPYNALHDQGYPSIGCAPCTRPISPGEDPRAGRWWWEQPDHRECGLHVTWTPDQATTPLSILDDR